MPVPVYISVDMMLLITFFSVTKLSEFNIQVFMFFFFVSCREDLSVLHILQMQ